MVHEVDMAVELVMEAGIVLAFSWAMDGLKEGLAVELREEDDSSRRAAECAVEVTERSEWARFLGQSVTGAGIAWHVPNEGTPEMPWSFRVDFANSESIVIALGESDDSTTSGIRYMPDSLVVIFDRFLADSYRIPASDISSLASG
ncbi:hypothetical protein OIE63_11815 [Streptomyces sp. NBC_01795]|uniref:hypothetical protein n=1 Tax=unclassified Streptomyces TaxID=2593676 RepID=UPI002DDBA77A|nr:MULTISPECIES: hypothetical protein [unclassified Streptomyces]WSA92179.1 hypothetical protein OIE63_11815 [Streptomyces sp. NBC_01795]WSB76545.1 hypothetical protein OHB04_12610 [Streptomyces sp. NBC_01775]WSS15167.1 hypothetical protein OG533_27245 [Streptomyces sp. NBC_01186]